MILELTNVQESTGYTPLEEGQYTVALTDTEFTQSKNGNPMLVTEFKVIGDKQKRGVKEYFMLDNEVGLSRAKQFLRLAGLDTNAPININEVANGGELIGKRLDAYITQREYTNEFNKTVLSNRVKYFVDAE